MAEENKLDIRYVQAAEVIKNAILSAQYEAQRGANSIQLMLYYSGTLCVAKYASWQVGNECYWYHKPYP